MTEVLLTGLKIGESARWHDGRLWLSHWGAQQILAVDLGGNAEVMATVPTTMPFSIDWLPDGRLLVVAGPESRLLRQEPDGSLVDHADLRGLGAGLNELVVDGHGRIWVNGGTDFHPDEGEAPGFVALITPDGRVRRVAEEIALPNGMAVTPDDSTLIVSESFGGTLTAFDIDPDGSLSNRRVWAAVPGDGIVLDTEGAVWTPGWAEGGPACGSPRAARCWTRSRSTGPGSPAPSAARTAGRCSCWRPTGGCRTASRTTSSGCSPDRRPARCSPPAPRPPTPATPERICSPDHRRTRPRMGCGRSPTCAARRIPYRRCRPNRTSVPAIPTSTAGPDPSPPSRPASRVSPPPPRMLLTAAIMLPEVNRIPTHVIRTPVLATAAAISSSGGGASKNCSASGVRPR